MVQRGSEFGPILRKMSFACCLCSDNACSVCLGLVSGNGRRMTAKKSNLFIVYTGRQWESVRGPHDKRGFDHDTMAREGQGQGKRQGGRAVAVARCKWALFMEHTWCRRTWLTLTPKTSRKSGTSDMPGRAAARVSIGSALAGSQPSPDGHLMPVLLYARP